MQTRGLPKQPLRMNQTPINSKQSQSTLYSLFTAVLSLFSDKENPILQCPLHKPINFNIYYPTFDNKSAPQNQTDTRKSNYKLLIDNKILPINLEYTINSEEFLACLNECQECQWYKNLIDQIFDSETPLTIGALKNGLENLLHQPNILDKLAIRYNLELCKSMIVDKTDYNSILSIANDGFIPAKAFLIKALPAIKNQNIMNAVDDAVSIGNGNGYIPEHGIIKFAQDFNNQIFKETLNNQYLQAAHVANYLQMQQKPDHTQIFKLYLAASNSCDLEALLGLATCYETGSGTVKNDKAAFATYQKAAAIGSIVALEKLATFYKDGTGTTKSDDKFLEITRKIANCYKDGYLVAKDYNKSIALYKQIEKESLEAAFELFVISKRTSANPVDLKNISIIKEMIIFYTKKQDIEYYSLLIDLSNRAIELYKANPDFQSANSKHILVLETNVRLYANKLLYQIDDNLLNKTRSKRQIQ